MTDIIIEQAMYGSLDAGGYRFLARSPGFLDEWLPEAQRLCTGFGERPSGVACPAALFAQPFGRRHVAIVQVADQGTDDAGRPGALGFHLLIVPRAAYRAFGGDPFPLAERSPPPWQARGELPVLSWPAEALKARTVDQVRRVLKRADGPNLLGASQVLVDGGRVVFQRNSADKELLRDLWTLLPTTARSELWPASFAFGNALQFHALAIPKAERDDFAQYQTEEQAGDYPEGRYELALQIAAEAGDQPSLDRLFARRSGAETLRLALYLLALAVVVSLLVGLLNPAAPPETAKRPPNETGKGPQIPAVLDLPPIEQVPALSRQERDRLTRELAPVAQLAGVESRDTQRCQVTLAVGLGLNFAQAPLLAYKTTFWFLGPERLIAAIDRCLGTPDPRRDPGELSVLGPPQRQLRALLWKHHVAEYNDPRLNPFELVERLAQVVASAAKSSL